MPDPGNFTQKYCLSVCSACVAEFVTYPLDLVKTRLQMQGEGVRQVAQYRGLLSTGLGVAREEGLAKLWQGVTPGMARHIIYTGVRISLYDAIRSRWSRDMNLMDRAAVGMFSGGLGQLVASPADLIKVRMQMEGRRRLQVC